MLIPAPYLSVPPSAGTRKRDVPVGYIGIYRGTSRGRPALFAISLGVFGEAGDARDRSEKVAPKGLVNAQPLTVVPRP